MPVPRCRCVLQRLAPHSLRRSSAPPRSVWRKRMAVFERRHRRIGWGAREAIKPSFFRWLTVHGLKWRFVVGRAKAHVFDRPTGAVFLRAAPYKRLTARAFAANFLRSCPVSSARFRMLVYKILWQPSRCDRSTFDPVGSDQQRLELLVCHLASAACYRARTQ